MTKKVYKEIVTENLVGTGLKMKNFNLMRVTKKPIDRGNCRSGAFLEGRLDTPMHTI